jgi:hypothetical protein
MASAQVVFDLIDRMPNKFPVYRFLEKGPFFFIRILLVDGFGSAWSAARLKRPDNELKLNVGDSMGPFTLIECQKPAHYMFSLKSFFFNCRTGYSLAAQDGKVELCFDLFTENPTFIEKAWWSIFKSFHRLFADKALRVIKEKAEHNEPLQRTA